MYQRHAIVLNLLGYREKGTAYRCVTFFIHLDFYAIKLRKHFLSVTVSLKTRSKTYSLSGYYDIRSTFFYIAA